MFLATFAVNRGYLSPTDRVMGVHKTRKFEKHFLDLT